MILGSCPDCGLVAELVAFASGPLAKEQLARAIALPKEIQAELIPYLGLFRPGPGKRALTDPKAARLLTEFVELVKGGSVQWKKQPARPCPPRLWAQAMRQMVEGKLGLDLPMKSHGYLTSVAYSLADKADAGREHDTRQAEAGGYRPPPPAPEPEPEEPVSEEAEDNRREFFDALGKLSGRFAFPKSKSAQPREPQDLVLHPCGECAACKAGVPSSCSDRRLDP